MKTIRLFFALMIIFLLGISDVSEASPGVSYGYILLISQGGDSATPIELQSIHNFNHLAPKLLSAQRQGDVISFEPEFSFGFLKVEYRSSFDITSFVSLPVYDNIDSIHLFLIKKLQDQKQRSLPATISPPVFYLRLYSSCFSGDSLGANIHVVASLRNSAGVVVANYEGDADSDGYFWDCFQAGPHTYVHPGFKVTIKRYQGNSLLSIYEAQVPRITFKSVNKLTAVTTGTAPAGKAFNISWYHENLNLANTYLYINKAGTIPGSGSWSVDFGTIKFRGGDHFNFYLKQTTNLYFLRYFYVPYVYCELSDNYCGLYGFPGQNASLSITHKGKIYTFNGRFNEYGGFYVELLDGNLDPIFLTAGDKISGTGITTYFLPKLTAVIRPATDTIDGIAPPNKNFWVYLYIPYPNYDWYYKWIHSSANGNYVADFSSSVDITRIATAEIFYTDPITGNETDYYYSMPA